MAIGGGGGRGEGQQGSYSRSEANDEAKQEEIMDFSYITIISLVIHIKLVDRPTYNTTMHSS